MTDWATKMAAEWLDYRWPNDDVPLAVWESLATVLREAHRKGEESMRERASREHESVNPASDDERYHGAPGAGAMGAVIEYRDRIRSIAILHSEAVSGER